MSSHRIRFANVALASLTIALSFTILGLAAHSISFIKNLQWNQQDFITVTSDIWILSERQYEPRTQLMWYLPTNFGMRDIYTLLVVGVFGTVLGGLVLLLGWNLVETDVRVCVSFTGREGPTIRLSRSITKFTLNSVTAALFAIATTISWYRYRHTGWPYPVWVPESLSPESVAMRYRYPVQHWTFETWNRLLASHVQIQTGSQTTPMSLQSLATQAQAARILTVPALILSVLPLILQLWVWRRTNIAVRERDIESPARKELVMMDSDGGAESGIDNYSPLRSTHMPRQQRWSEFDIKEMMGDTGHSELDGGVAAAEKAVGT